MVDFVDKYVDSRARFSGQTSQGHEVPDGTPMQELLDRRSNNSLLDTIRMATMRGQYEWVDGDENDSDYDVEADDGSLPDYSPFSEGFEDHFGMSVEKATELLENARKTSPSKSKGGRATKSLAAPSEESEGEES